MAHGIGGGTGLGVAATVATTAATGGVPIIPLALTAGSAIFDFLSGKGRSRERRRRFDEALARLSAEERATVGRESERIGKLIAGQVRGTQQDASARAISLGRSSSAESFILPAVAQVRGQGSRFLGRRTADIQGRFAQRRAGLISRFADRPIEPGGFDFAAGALRGASDIFQTESFIQRLLDFQQTDAGLKPFVPRIEVE